MIVPRRSCSGVRDDVALGSRRGDTNGDRWSTSFGPRPGRRVVSTACCPATAPRPLHPSPRPPPSAAPAASTAPAMLSVTVVRRPSSVAPSPSPGPLPDGRAARREGPAALHERCSRVRIICAGGPGGNPIGHAGAHGPQDAGVPRDRRARMISSGSGKRCSVPLEKMSSPSATTSNWPRSPTITSGSTSSACLIEAARLEAFGR